MNRQLSFDSVPEGVVDDEMADAFEMVRKSLETAYKRTERLLSLAAEETRPCAKCKTPLYFIRHRPRKPGERGALTPYTADGTNHFENCPHAEHFKRNQRRAW